MKMEGVLVLDVETDGIGTFRPPKQTVVQIGMILDGTIERCFLVQGVKEINPEVPHSITVEQCDREGLSHGDTLHVLRTMLDRCTTVVGHNIQFDLGCLKHTLGEEVINQHLKGKDVCCTMLTTVDLCKIPFRNSYAGSTKYKYPRLSELYEFLHDHPVPDFEKLHDALEDCKITLSCYQKLLH